jgi:hypothetical protein
MKFQYLTCCVNSDGESITAMIDTARAVSIATFKRRCDWQVWARARGYSVGGEPGLHLQRDYHVAYRKGTYQGRPCYFAVWSAIEWIFVAPEHTYRGRRHE